MRVLTRLVAGAIAAVVTAAGVIALIEIVHAAGGPGYAHVDWPRAVSALSRNTWSDTGPRVLGGILVALGVLCCWLGLRRDRTTGEPLVAPDPTGGWFTSRRSLRRSLRSAALATPTVAKARVRGGRGRLRVRAVLVDDPGTTEQDLADRLRRRLEDIQPTRPPALKIRYVHRGDPPPPTPGHSPVDRSPAGASSGASTSARGPARVRIDAPVDARAEAPADDLAGDPAAPRMAFGASGAGRRRGAGDR